MLKKFKGSVATVRALMSSMCSAYRDVKTDYYWSEQTVKAFHTCIIECRVYTPAESGYPVAVGVLESCQAPHGTVYNATISTVESYERESDGRTCYRIKRDGVYTTGREGARQWLNENMPGKES